MLQQIGDSLKGHKWLTYVVFGALALIFAAWGAYGVANLSFGTSSYAAKVNGHTIPYEDVKAPWQREQNEWQQRQLTSNRLLFLPSTDPLSICSGKFY